MSQSSEETSDLQSQNSAKPIEEWTKEELQSALDQVWQKQRIDWTSADTDLLWEDKRRKKKENTDALESLKAKSEFNIEEWTRFIAEIAVAIYVVVKRIELRNQLNSRSLSIINEGLAIVNKNVLSTPVPPPYPPPYISAGPNLSGIEMKLDEILQLLGGGSSRWR